MKVSFKDIFACGAALFFGAWTAATLLSQPLEGSNSNRLRRRVGRVFPVLPSYNFFAPNPGTQDARIYARTLGLNGKISRWESVLSTPHRTRIGAFFNPKGREKKVILDLLNELLGHARTGPVEIRTSRAYEVICRYVSGQLVQEGKTIENTVGFQFAVGQDCGFHVNGKSRIVFTSRMEEIILSG